MLVALGATIALGTTDLAAQRASERRVANPGETQFEIQLLRPSGGPVVPIFEGWYRNRDGTFELSFGYFNVNTVETLEIPLGADNFIAPAEFDGGQPTRVRAGPRQRPAPLGRVHRDGAGGLRRPRRGLDAARARADARGAGAFDQPLLRAGRVGVSGTVEHVAAAALGAGRGPPGAGPRGITGAGRLAQVGVPFELGAWVARDAVAGRGRASDQRQVVQAPGARRRHVRRADRQSSSRTPGGWRAGRR